ncbi:MAG: dTDP-4-dehydrorhamnose 3,5-epimerase [Candidatus Marinimicrobia bacterium]|jgi:dTDP-4-dehydrorhamnose 3,5-epimerase|nr:dTDP-4-dehydrorhamnose 3,5-epimerase [Candidatus Neomarinimicrobiota bacterium]
MAINFDIKESKILKDVKIIKPSITEDNRGNIWTSFLKDEIEKYLPNGLCFKHDKFSQSKKNVLRGIHGDEKSWKLVTCVYGDIFQVVVDCRKESSTYKKSESFSIDGENLVSILIPLGFGNAYCVKSEKAVYHYKLAYKGEYIDADEQFSYKWNDPLFNIKWPTETPILSDRDRK